MTNAAIIEHESLRLVEQGVLRMVNIGGMDMPEPIHTFNGWKELGFQVKKGEHSKIKFPIWKHTTKTVEKDGKEEERSAMFTKVSAFFTFDQVEPITAKK